MKPLPVHLGNIVTEGSHPLRFDASERGPWPTPSFTSLCLRQKTDSADFLQSTGYRIRANVFPFDQERKSPHTFCKALCSPCISPYFFLLKLFFYFQYMLACTRTHTHTLTHWRTHVCILKKTGALKTTHPKQTSSVHFPASQISLSWDPRHCELTWGCPIKCIYFLELKNICWKLDYHLVDHQQLLKTRA